MAFLPWNGNQRKAIGLGQYVIELVDRVICIFELCVLTEVTFTITFRGNAWSQADHCTTHDSAHRVCKRTICMTGILVAQLDAHEKCAFLA